MPRDPHVVATYSRAVREANCPIQQELAFEERIEKKPRE